MHACVSVDQELKNYFFCDRAFFIVVDVNAFYGVVQLEIQYGMQDDFSFTLPEVYFPLLICHREGQLLYEYITSI